MNLNRVVGICSVATISFAGLTAIPVASAEAATDAATSRSEARVAPGRRDLNGQYSVVSGSVRISGELHELVKQHGEPELLISGNFDGGQAFVLESNIDIGGLVTPIEIAGSSGADFVADWSDKMPCEVHLGDPHSEIGYGPSPVQFARNGNGFLMTVEVPAYDSPGAGIRLTAFIEPVVAH